MILFTNEIERAIPPKANIANDIKMWYHDSVLIYFPILIYLILPPELIDPS